MLDNQEIIDESNLYVQTEDFNFIREKALSYIQQLSSDTWTDHNLHDPGITILEAISYALTDIGFRMNFAIPDLMTSSNGDFAKNSFFFPDQIFPSRPVTLNDYRKLLVDIPLIRNAWLKPITEPINGITLDYEPLYVYTQKGILLTRTEVEQLMIPLNERNQILLHQEVFIQGFYAIQIAFDYQFNLGAIDSGEMFEPIYQANLFGDIYYDVSNWQELVNNSKALHEIANLYEFDHESLKMNFEVSSKNKYNNNDGKLFERVLNEWVFNIQIRRNDVNLFTMRDVLFIPFIKENKGISGQELLFFLSKSNYSFFNVCFQKIVALSNVYSDVLNVLHENRNLCEEFLPQFSAIPTIELRVCMDVDVETKADIEMIQAKIFSEIINYISPPIRFYTKSDMIEMGYDHDEIFDGPLLSHGFLIEDQMGENSFEDFTLNTSDILNAIFEIEDLLNCRNIQLSLFDEQGNQIKQTSAWEIILPKGHKPVLNLRRSKILFYKNQLPLISNYKECLLKLSFLQTNRKPAVYDAQTKLDLANQFRNISTHYSIANEFPATYKIGKNLPDSFLQEKMYSPSKQFEGYLLFFEQVMANFLKDLDQFKEVLSWNKISHIQHNSTENEWRRSYLLSKHVDATWQNLNEPKEEFLRKRNESLDFLLARFAESLKGIDHYYYLASDNLGVDKNQYLSYLIQLKENFLLQFPKLSMHRGAAVNLFVQSDYLQVSISGFESRISCLLGCELMINGMRKVASQLDAHSPDERGYFHVLEHILFRLPKISEEVNVILKEQGISIEVPAICVDDDCLTCQDVDPYSNKATILLPAWIKVYSDVHYRDYIEKRIRQEAPTHIFLRVCWLNEESMIAYENALQGWWKLRHALVTQKSINQLQIVQYIQGQNLLIQVIKNQRSEYFPATLHGCDDEGEENNTRVFLNKTILGDPKNHKL